MTYWATLSFRQRIRFVVGLLLYVWLWKKPRRDGDTDRAGGRG